MEVGAPVWAQVDGIWHEASILQVDNARGMIECAYVEQDAREDHLIMEGEFAVAPQPGANDFISVTRRRRSSSLRRQASRAPVHVHEAHVLPRDASEMYQAVEDLTRLVHLHEPAILHVLRKRFFYGHIYTSTGSILVAMNPFRRLELYNDVVKAEYYGHGEARGSSEDVEATAMGPHVFGVADQAFRTMLSSRMEKKHDQTILVSGESGAGKTETTKLIMSYLAYVSVRRREEHGGKASSSPATSADATMPTIHDRVLESNPILEAFGNARTNRNNNSSRFGKFIKLGFGATGDMLGASISTYLLERVRIVSQGQGERNYHIFYELCCGATAHERETLELGEMTAYRYLNQSGCVRRLDGVDDARSYQETRHAMSSIGMDDAEQMDVMKIVSAVLHLGNVDFVPEAPGKEEAVVDPATSSSLHAVCRMLGVTVEALETTLCTKQIKAGCEFITTRLPVDRAASTRDTVVKTLYAKLFGWLVARINASIEYKEGKNTQFIGVVDIFGFEIFEHNSLEQLCINFANEKLQQHFSSFVFDMEQKEYISEEIPWQFVDYPNNDICVAMLDGKGSSGLFALLDEQCIMPRGNDEKFGNRLYEVFGNHKSFMASKLQRAKRQFEIRHYAGDVLYSGDGFCEKNKDHMHTEAADLMKTSSSEFVRQLYESTESVVTPAQSKRSSTSGADPSRRRSGIMASTVVTKFKNQLQALLDVINTTQPHFIRCIKPNDEVSSSHFDRQRVVEQLRCSGVLEAVKISRSGYPVRFNHDVFIKSYDCILSSTHRETAPSKQYVQHMVREFVNKFPELRQGKDIPAFQVGKTKVFCLHIAHQTLQMARSKALYHSVVTIQRYGRGYAKRAAFNRKRVNAVRLQAFWRCCSLSRRYNRQVREHRCATLLQARLRGYLVRLHCRRVKACIVVQSFVRGWLVRRDLSAETISFDRDASYAGTLEQSPGKRSSGTAVDSESRASFDHPILDPRVSRPISDPARSFCSDINDPQGRFRGSSPSRRSSGPRRSRDIKYEPPKNIQQQYEIVWECGLLGLYFESDPETGMPVVRRVHESLSNCADIFEVSRGDILLAVGKESVMKGDIRRILALLQEVPKPVRLKFQRNAAVATRYRSGSLELLGEEDYEVLWLENVPLGIGFRPCPDTGLPSVLNANGNPTLPGMFNVRHGDYLIFINEFSTSGVSFKKVIEILERGRRPAVLRFRHNDSIDDFMASNPQDDNRYMRQSRMSLNPKVDHSLYYITWKQEDGPLGIVVKQESCSYYPRVINVKNEGAVCRESQKNRVEVGDILLSINNNNISKMGFTAAMRLLQKGPKPLLLMFQRPRLSYEEGSKSCNL